MDINENIGSLLTSKFRKDADAYPNRYYEVHPDGETEISANAGYLLAADSTTIADLVQRLIVLGNLSDNYNEQRVRETRRADTLKVAMHDNGKIIGRKFWELCKRNGISEREYDDFLREVNDDISLMNLARKTTYNVAITWQPKFRQEFEVEADDEEEAGELAAAKFSLNEVRAEVEYEYDESDLEFDIEEQ